MNDRVKAIKAARKLIQSPSTWCKGHLARDDQDQRVTLLDATAAKYDAYGALAKVCVKPGDDEAHDLHHECLKLMHAAIREIEGHDDKECSVVIYNDRNDHGRVLALFDKAIQLGINENENEKENEKETKILQRSALRNAAKPRDSQVSSGGRKRKSDLRGRHDSGKGPKKERKRRNVA
jgi:hypothetical protein